MLTPIAATAPNDIGAFLAALLVILVSAKIFGEVAARFGQSPVLGELFAGLLLGPYAIGLIPEHSAIHFFGELGVLLLLFEIGLETDLQQMLKVGIPALRVAAIGVVVPLAGGFLFAEALGDSTLASIVIGATLTATSVGITARVLSDLGYLKTKEARIILGAAVIDDLIGIVLLALVQRLGDTGQVSVGLVVWSIVSAFGFLAIALFVGRWAAPTLVRVVDRARARGTLIVFSLALALTLAVLALGSGSAPLVGALAAGLMLAATHRRETIERHVQPLTDICAPVFFVSVGASVDLALLSPLRPENWPTLGLLAGLTVIAILGKLASGLGAGRARKLAVGVGMVPRGEVGLIFAGVGATAGIVTGPTFGALVGTVMLTTLVAPPMLRAVFSRVDDES